MRFSGHPAYESFAVYEALPVRRLSHAEGAAMPFFVPTEEPTGPGPGPIMPTWKPHAGGPYRTACAWGDVVVDGERVERVVYER